MSEHPVESNSEGTHVQAARAAGRVPALVLGRPQMTDNPSVTLWGIDAAPASTGWASITAHDDGTATQKAAAIAPPTGAMTGDPATWLRCTLIVNRIAALRSRSEQPALALIESDDSTMSRGPGQGSRGSQWRPRLVGAICVELTRWGIRFALVNPSTLKAYAAGGKADKAAMRHALPIVAPDKAHSDENACDAWWLARLAADTIDIDPLVPGGRGPNAARAIDRVREELNLDPFPTTKAR